MTEETKKGLLSLLIMFGAFVAVDKLILNPPRRRVRQKVRRR